MLPGGDGIHAAGIMEQVPVVGIHGQLLEARSRQSAPVGRAGVVLFHAVAADVEHGQAFQGLRRIGAQGPEVGVDDLHDPSGHFQVVLFHGKLSAAAQGLGQDAGPCGGVQCGQVPFAHAQGRKGLLGRGGHKPEQGGRIMGAAVIEAVPGGL